MAAPGWYPDPSGARGQRYWDGEVWHDAVPVKPGPPAPKGSSGRVILAVVAGLLFVVVVMSVAGGGDDERPKASGSSGTGTKPELSAERYQREVIFACQDSVLKGLKDPDSAKFDRWAANEVKNAGAEPPAPLPFNRAAGDKYFSASGLVNARNGFGGYTGNQLYSCSATATRGGDVKAIAQPLELPAG